MLEKNYDDKIILFLVDVYKEIDEQINLAGCEVVAEHTPGLIERRTKVRKYLENYCQLFVKGMAYADNLSPEEIGEYVTERMTPGIKNK